VHGAAVADVRNVLSTNAGNQKSMAKQTISTINVSDQILMIKL